MAQADVTGLGLLASLAGGLLGMLTQQLLAVLVGACLPVLFMVFSTLGSVRRLIEQIGPKADAVMKQVQVTTERLNSATTGMDESAQRAKKLLDATGDLGRLHDMQALCTSGFLYFSGDDLIHKSGNLHFHQYSPCFGNIRHQKTELTKSAGIHQIECAKIDTGFSQGIGNFH